MPEPNYDMFRSSLPFFGGLTDADIAVILKAARMVRLPEESVLAREGEPADTSYMLMKGRARLSRAQGHGVPTVLGDALPGDVVGVLGLLDTGVYMTSAEAVTEISALALDRDKFYALGAKGEVAVYRLIRALAPRCVASLRRSLAMVDALFKQPDEGIRMMERVILASSSRRRT